MNYFRIFLTFLLLTAEISALHAQNNSLLQFGKKSPGINESKQNQLENNDGQDKNEENGNSIISIANTVINPFLSKALKREGDMTPADERYYANVARQFGWWVGLGRPLSKSQAQNSGQYYRLSDKNDKGRWQRVDYVCNNPENDNSLRIERLGGLIVPTLTDGHSNREIIGRAVAWEFISDPSGALMLEERGFDSDGNLLYIMNSTEYSEGRFVLSFLDSDGLPLFPNRTLHVQCDEQGRFQVVNFTDDAGYFLPNANNVYEIHIDYSPDDYKFINCNIAGNPL